MRNEDSLCEGGERIGIGPCAKCGATQRDHCRRPLPDPRIAQLETERDALRAEVAELRLAKGWLDSVIAQERDALRAENERLKDGMEMLGQSLKAEQQAADTLRARVAELSSLLTEAVNEMEPDIEAKYADTLHYQSMARKYEQDMDLPKRIRAALAGKEGE